ncbi:MAG: dihydrofolate reductase [Tannerellaceae bacterium]|nr:dihydrofolate reductase [Tannerellaceae bacterium]
MSTVSIIAAIAEHNAIGKNQQLLCHLPNDLKRFKELTSGHAIVMGRKTFKSLPKGALPNRKNIILTSIPDAGFVDCFACESMEDALDICEKEDEVFMIGGAMVYKQALERADKMYLTYIHHTFDGADTFFPEINYADWKEVEREDHPADDKHPYPYSFVTFERVR